MNHGNPGLKASPEPLVTAYDCAMLDLDGVVYVGPDAIGGVPETLAFARASGMTLAFVTNNAARTPATVASHLTDLGVKALPSDVVTSAQAAAREVAKHVPAASPVLVVGGEGLHEALHELGLVPVTSVDDGPVAVVQGFHPSVGWQQLAEAAYALQRGARWVASNLDLTVPTARGLAPGNGTLVRALSSAVGRQPDAVAGKPFRPLFDETLLRIGAQRPLVVGDRLDTDIEGAVNVAADSLLVMTGVTGVREMCRADPEHRPTYVGWDIRALLTAHPVPTRVDERWSLGGWTLSVDGGRVVVHARGEHDDDGLRCVASAAWAWRDGHGGDAPDLEDLERLWPHG